MSRPVHPVLRADAVGARLPDGRLLFRDVSLVLAGERTGLVGANGAGKSTLLRILAGERAADDGAVQRAGRVAHLAQGALEPRVAGPGRTVADALGVAERLAALARVLAGSTDAADHDRVGTDGWDLAERAAAHLARLGVGHVALERPLATLSGGEATRVALARLTLDAPDLLLLDEPTNHLDRDGREAVAALVRDWPRGLLVATHDRALLAHVDRIVELERGGATSYGGAWAAYVAQRDAERAAAAAAVTHAERALRSTERTLRAQRDRQARHAARDRRGRATENQSKLLLNFRKARSEGAAARLGRVADERLSAGRAALDAARARAAADEPLRFAIPSAELPAGKRVALLEGVEVRFAGACTPALRDCSVAITGAERLSLTGPNGSGKSTLLALLAGRLTPTAGRCTVGLPPAAVAFLDQHALLLGDEGLSLLEAVLAAAPGATPAAARATLARFLFRGDAALAPVGTLSGGERVRAALAALFTRPAAPQLLLLDEPTNHLDLDGIAAVEAALRSYDGALVVASHDAAFLGAIGVERTVELAGGG